MEYILTLRNLSARARLSGRLPFFPKPGYIWDEYSEPAPVSMKYAAIYTRVSTDKQEQRRTMESQVAELQEACRAAGATIVKEYADEGVSGGILARPGLDRLRDDAARGLFQAVFITSPDRLSRKYVLQILVLEELHKQGVQVVFTDREFTDSPEDQLLLGA